MDLGHRQVADTAGDLDPAVVSDPLAVGPGFQRRRGGPQQHGDVLELPAFDGYVTHAEARGLQVLVAGLLLLIHHDQAQLPARSEDGAAGADDDPLFAGRDLGPGQRALHAGQPAMDDRHVAETASQPVDQLRGQGDFRNQQDHLPPGLEEPAHGPDVNLGLAAPADAEQQGHAEPAFVDQGRD